MMTPKKREVKHTWLSQSRIRVTLASAFEPIEK